MTVLLILKHLENASKINKQNLIDFVSIINTISFIRRIK